MTDPIFASYLAAANELCRQLGPNHPRYRDATGLYQRLVENTYRAERHGDDPENISQRSRIIAGLQDLAREELRVDFDDLQPPVASLSFSSLKMFLGPLRVNEIKTRFRIMQGQFLRPLLTAMLGAGLVVAVFVIWLFPSMKIITWLPQSSGEQNVISNLQTVQAPPTLRRQPSQSVYVKTNLLSADTYPTALTIPQGKVSPLYAGTYGGGLFESDAGDSWRLLGLDNLLISDVVVRGGGSNIVAATNQGIFVTEDTGQTWNPMGPVKSLVTVIAIPSSDSRLLLAGTSLGLYRSEDAGTTWIGPILEGEVVTAIEFAPSDPTRVYLSSLSGSVFRSDDSGKKWYPIWSADDKSSTPICVDFLASNIIYIGPTDKGIFRSTDAGQTWTYWGLKGVSVSRLLMLSGPQRALFAGSDNERGLFVSWDSGSQWQNYGSLRDNIIDMIEEPSTPGAVIATTTHQGLLRTEDGGRTWRSLGLKPPSLELDLPMAHVAPVAGEPKHLYAIPGFETGLFESTDGGASWAAVAGNPDLMDAQLKRVSTHPRDADQVYVSALGGIVMRSSDGGRSWNSITSNLPRGGYAPLAVAVDGTLFAGPSNRGVWRLPPNRMTWEPTGLAVSSIVEIQVSETSDMVFAFDEFGILYVSQDEGNSWFAAPQTFMSVVADPKDSDHLVGISETCMVVTSADAGTHWVEGMILPESCSPEYTKLAVDPAVSGLVYLANGDTFRRSIDFGSTWVELAVSGFGVPYVGTDSQLYSFGSRLLHVSADQGQTWTRVMGAEILSPVTDVEEVGGSTQLIGTANDGLLMSVDGGQNWNETSIGEGYEVLALWVDRSQDQLRALALVSDKSTVSLGVSSDARVWRLFDAPCGVRGSYFREVRGIGSPQWQLVCSDPDALLALNPSRNIIWETIRLFPSSGYVVDAVATLDQVAYVVTSAGYPLRNSVWVTFNAGRSWRYVGYIPSNEKWALSLDRDGKAILVGSLGGQVVAVFAPRSATGLVSYVLLAFYVLLLMNLAAHPSRLKTLLYDLRTEVEKIIGRTKAHKSLPSPVFLWILCPTLALTSIAILQAQSADSILSLLLNDLVSGSKPMAAALRVLGDFPVPISTPAALTLGIMLIAIFLVLAVMGGVLTLSLAVLERKLVPGVWQRVWAGGFPITCLGTFVCVVLSSLVTPTADGSNMQLLLLAAHAAGAVFLVLLGYRIQANALTVSADLTGVSILRLVTLYVAIVSLVSMLGQMMLRGIAEALPMRHQELVSEISLTRFAVWICVLAGYKLIFVGITKARNALTQQRRS